MHKIQRRLTGHLSTHDFYFSRGSSASLEAPDAFIHCRGNHLLYTFATIYFLTIYIYRYMQTFLIFPINLPYSIRVNNIRKNNSKFCGGKRS